MFQKFSTHLNSYATSSTRFDTTDRLVNGHVDEHFFSTEEAVQYLMQHGLTYERCFDCLAMVFTQSCSHCGKKYSLRVGEYELEHCEVTVLNRILQQLAYCTSSCSCFNYNVMTTGESYAAVEVKNEVDMTLPMLSNTQKKSGIDNRRKDIDTMRVNIDDKLI